ncbi:MAG: VWA domain-containing protein [Verrucomicrobiales bacterium]
MRERVSDIFSTWFPKKRQAVSFSSALVWIVFLVVYAVAVIACEWQGWLRFSYWSAFWIMVLTPWFWWMSLHGYSALGQTRSNVALVVRLLLLGLFAAALAEPRTVRSNTSLSAMYALDVSDSMGNAVSTAAMEFIQRTASNRQDKDSVGMVAFGSNAAVELPPRSAFPLESLETINSVVGKDGTDLAKALSLSAAMLPDDAEGRIVLMSDGSATEGELTPVLEQLKARNIAVDVLPVDFDFEKEAWVERLDLPKSVKLGETYEASVLIGSLQAQKGTLVLEENGQEVFRDDIEIESGKKRISIPIKLREAGYYAYTARLIVPEDQDGWKENNLAINDIYIAGEGKILVVTDPAGDPRDAARFIETLRASRRVVEMAQAFQVPRDTLSLMPYDAVVFINVPADALDVAQMQAVRDAVRQQGVGFLMIGGANSFGPGGYNRSAIEEALPVEMDIKQRKIMPKGALAIILHTCEFADGNTWAKRITKSAIKVLGDEDDVGVLAYIWNGGNNGAPDTWIFPLSPADHYQQFSVKINQAQIGDMPSFVPTMTLGLNALVANDAAMKHMLIISDGDPTPPPPNLLQSFVQAGISVSTIAINPHGGQDISMMRSIAATTGGRYYFPQDPRQLPSIFIKEAKELKRNMIQNETFTPAVEFPSAILKGIDALPQLHGYVLTSAKAQAEVVLKSPVEDELNPVLATWRYGTGTSAAFTSDMSPNWGKDWIDWDQFQPFVNQLMIAISRVQTDSDLVLTANAEGTTGLITIDDYHETQSFLTIEAQIAGPQNRIETVTLEQTGARRYKGTFPLWGRGRYQILAAAVDSDDRTDKAVGALSVAYSPEFLNFRSDPLTLKRIASETGGRILTGKEEALFEFERSPRESTKPAIDWFLWLLAFLLPLDVAVRRVQLDWQVIRCWFGFGKKAESAETMSALLKRKAEVSATIERAAPPGQRSRTAKANAPPVKAAPQETVKSSEPATTAEPEDLSKLSTTERLLARKRQRENKDEH